MSAFGIFAAILTFVYVIYYAVMISMDLFGNKSQQKDNVEVIASLDNKHNEEVVDETPTFVDEEGATDAIKAPFENTDTTVSEDVKQEVSEEDIASADNNILYNEAKAAKDKAAELQIHSDADLNADQFDDWFRKSLIEKESATESFGSGAEVRGWPPRHVNQRSSSSGT